MVGAARAWIMRRTETTEHSSDPRCPHGAPSVEATRNASDGPARSGHKAPSWAVMRRDVALRMLADFQGYLSLLAERQCRKLWPTRICLTVSMEMIVSTSKPIILGAAIFYGGLIAGILDGADNMAAYYLAAGFNPIQVLQFIASGFYGAAAFQMGTSGAAVGLLAHFFIAFVIAAIYVGATQFLPMLGRKAAMWGPIYGVAVFIVMNFVVLPHTAVVKSPLSWPLLLNGVLAHALFVGLPIALAARRTTNPSSFNPQPA